LVKNSKAMAKLLSCVDEILPEKDFLEKINSGKKLRIKIGADPTAPDLHLGHSVILNKLRLLQDLGHTVVFIIGDATAAIGDPSGKNKTRPALSSKEIREHAKTYESQIYKVLDKDKVELRYNSEWLDKMSATELVKIASCNTVARMLERDDFAKRYKANQAIGIHEFLYPLLQGYDSVAIDADIELGGTDQKFNLLMGRELQKFFGKSPQAIMTLPLLEGLDGINKMSKSLKNTIDIEDNPNNMFGKIMSISDELMWRYFDLLSFKSANEILSLKQEAVAGKNPKNIKVMLAKELVSRFHDDESASRAETEFEGRFKKGVISEDIAKVELSSKDDSLLVAFVLKQAGLVASTSEGCRMIKQGAVKLDGEKVAEHATLVVTHKEYLLQVGKRRAAVVSMSKHS
jgi:tyrosyl-tRNA synthetase